MRVPCGCLAEGAQRGQGGAHGVARRGRDHRVRQRRVELLAVALELLEAARVASQRTSASGGAPPRVLGAHLELHHRVSRQRIADALGEHRAASERHHAPAGPGQQLQHHLLLTRAEGGLALAVEEGFDRLAQPALELAVGVERLDPHLGRDRPRGGGLARAHEAHEHDRPARGETGRSLALRYPRLHPIRSS